MADDIVISDVFGQVTHPTAHQVQHLGTGGCARGESGQPSPKPCVQVVNETRLAVEVFVIAGIQLEALGVLQKQEQPSSINPAADTSRGQHQADR